MTQNITTMEALDMWQRVNVRTMKEMDCNLSPRQLNILLMVYLRKGPHSVKSLSENLTISKAATCRALDALSILGLIKRKKDTENKRNVFVQRTIQGSVYLSDYADIIMQEWAPVFEEAAPEVSGV